MNDYIKDWLFVIRNGSMDNTYKMAWAKAIVECCIESNDKFISFERLAKKIVQYYWDQTIFFELQQSPNPNKPPEIVSYTHELIKTYQSSHGHKPQKFIRCEPLVNINYSKVARTLKSDVCWRFLKVGQKSYQLYSLDTKNKIISNLDTTSIRDFNDILLEAINYRWSQKLEEHNSSPRICKKVRVIDLEDVKRKSLNKFRPILDKMGTTCFICGEEITNETPSIDHVIPWSYMYSDDLWNLVYTHKTCNSSKLNKLVAEEEIIKLENRNIQLFNKLEKENIKNKHREELKLAIEKNYVRKFWISFLG